MSNRLVLQSGREISLSEIWQECTYDGVIEGIPSPRINQNIVAQLRINKKYKLHGQVPLVLTPTERLIERASAHPPENVALLPEIKCIARFGSSSPTANGEGDYSTLVIAWFQDEFALPIQPSVLRQMLQLDWDALAANGSNW